nr:hypothetical protein [Tanacetum cinerariifolium]
MKNKACFNCGEFDHLSYDCGKWVDHKKTWAKNNYTHKSIPPRTAIHKTDRTPAAVNRTHVNSAQPKTTQDLMIILIQRVMRQYTRRARIAQSSALPTAVDEPASPIGDDSQGSGNSYFEARIKHLEDRDRGDDVPSGEDATIKGRSLETGDEAAIERSTEKGSDDTEEMSRFTTATVATPYTRRKGKEKMVKSETHKKKKLQEQMDVEMARQLEEEMARDAQRKNEQIAWDAEIARNHAEEELQIMIDGLDRNNETVAKYLQEYHQFAADLSIGERIELINDLVKYQDNYAKIQDFVPMGSKEERERFKRKGLRLEQDSAKKVKSSKEVSEEDLKAMMQLVPVEELWALVKETLNVKQATSNKEKELWGGAKKVI